MLIILPETIIALNIAIVSAIYKRKLILILMGLFLWFFREYNHSPPPNTIVSPTFGRVKNIDKTLEYQKISVYLSVLDPHYQIIPINDSVVLSKKYHKGKFEPILFNNSVEKTNKNEKMTTRFSSAEFGEYEIEQVSGTFARTIVNDCIVGEKYKIGKRFGLIKLGSRVNITFFNSQINILVKEGDYLDAGVKIAEIK